MFFMKQNVRDIVVLKKSNQLVQQDKKNSPFSKEYSRIDLILDVCEKSFP